VRRALGATREVPSLRSDSGAADSPLQPVDLPTHALEPVVIVRLEGGVTLVLQLLDLSLDGTLVDAYHVVVFVHLDVQVLADLLEQLVLSHLCVAGETLDAVGHLPELLDRHQSELMEVHGSYLARPRVPSPDYIPSRAARAPVGCGFLGALALLAVPRYEMRGRSGAREPVRSEV